MCKLKLLAYVLVRSYTKKYLINSKELNLLSMIKLGLQKFVNMILKKFANLSTN
jgi:hypothetical protein